MEPEADAGRRTPSQGREVLKFLAHTRKRLLGRGAEDHSGSYSLRSLRGIFTPTVWSRINDRFQLIPIRP